MVKIRGGVISRLQMYLIDNHSITFYFEERKERRWFGFFFFFFGEANLLANSNKSFLWAYIVYLPLYSVLYKFEFPESQFK